MEKAALFILLGILSWFDIRTRRLPVWLLVIGALIVAGMLTRNIYMGSSPGTLPGTSQGTSSGNLPGLLSGIFLGALPGVFLIVTGFITGWQIGPGDGVVFVITGMMLGLFMNLILLLGALALAGVGGGVYMLWKKKGRHMEIPFLPFVFVMYGGILLCQKYM